MSPSTAPASIEASCPGSPTRTSRASERSASVSRVISDSDTIEVSSTITTSWGRRWLRSWRKRLSDSRPASEQTVQGRGVQGEQPLAHGPVDVELRRLGVNRLLEARRRLAGRSRQRDQRRRPGARLLAQQRHDSRHGGGLAGARAAGHHGKPAQHRRGRRQRLASVDRLPEQASQTGGQHGLIDVGGRVGGEGVQRRRHPHLLAPVAVQVQPRPLESQRPGGCRRSTLAADTSPLPDTRVTHDSGSGHGSSPRSTGSSVSIAAVSRMRSQVDVDVAEPRRADGQRHRQRHLVVGLGGDRREPPCHVHVGGGQHPRLVEDAQQAGGVDGEARLERIAIGDGDRHRCVPASSASLSAWTSAAGGRQPNTPHGLPSMTGVPSPVIPRTNRYTTPARSRSGS